MTPHTLRNRKSELEEKAATVTPDRLEKLATSLIQQMQKEVHPLSASAESGNSEVMLDIEKDGIRCVLMRVRPPSRHHAGLSPRELEIARMVAEGYPNKIIADVLDISSWTVGTHLRRIFAKLHVSSRAAMVTRLLEEGLMPGHAADPLSLRSKLSR
jgi:DNA-binding CsgD family transcriptional regulator